MSKIQSLSLNEKLFAKTTDEDAARRAEVLFYSGFIPLLFVLLWKTTAFPQYEKAELLAMAFFTGCVALKMLLYDRWSVKEVIFLVLCVAIAGMSYYKSGFTRPLVVVIAVWGAKDLDGRKLLKVWLVMSVLNLVLAMSAALLEIIENYSFPWTDDEAVADTVYSIGITNTTDCAARVFFTMLVWFYLRGERLQWFEYLIGIFLAFGTYYFTGGRIDSGCIAITTMMFLVVNTVKNIKGKTKRYRAEHNAFPLIASLSMPTGAVASFTLCKLYIPSGIWKKLDEWSSGRLTIGHKIFEDYDIKLFGQKIEMYGNGRGETVADRLIREVEYNFMDISYQSILLLYGVAFLIIVLAFYSLLVWRQRKDIYLMLCVLLIAFNCMFAHHLTEIAYIPFVMLSLSRLTKDITNKKIFN